VAESNPEERREALPISEEPGFHLPNGDSKGHEWTRVWQPIMYERRSAWLVLIEIRENQPRRPARRGVVTGQGPVQVGFASLYVDTVESAATRVHDGPKDGFVDWTLHGAR
jgi:hypothetical protein